MPPESVRVDYTGAGDLSVPFFAKGRHPEIPGYRGRRGGDDDERYWNPRMPPCVPSDHRPANLFNSREAAEAAGAAARVELLAPPPPDEEEYSEEDYNPMCTRLHAYEAQARSRSSAASGNPFLLRPLKSTIPVSVRVAAGHLQCGRGWSRPRSWDSVSARWLAGSTHAGAASGLPLVRPILRGDRTSIRLTKIERRACQY